MEAAIQDEILLGTTGAARLLERKQKAFELQEVLEKEKIDLASKEKEFQRREEVMTTKNAKMEESLISFSKYLQENDVKKARANKRAAEERRLCEEKSREATELAMQLEHLKKEVTEACEIVCRNQRYQSYLEAVLEERDTFREIGDIMTRHATLAATNQELRKQQFEAGGELDRVRVETMAYAKTKSEEILAASTAIPKLRKEIEDLKEVASKLDREQQSANLKLRQADLEQEQVTRAINHLYQRCLESSKVVYNSQASLSTQIKVIANFISDHEGLLRAHT